MITSSNFNTGVGGGDMRILVLGAGATGGYFGGRLAAAGRDVTFLVRPERARQLAAAGLVIHSPAGSISMPVSTVTRDGLAARYDLVLLTCKAYDLDQAIEAIRPGMGADAVVLPLLNGMRHLDVLDRAFGAARVMGGLAKITATLKAGEVHHLKALHTLAYGARWPEQAQTVKALAADWRDVGFDAEASTDIVAEMWEKWVLIAALAGSTCLMRAALCDIVAEPAGESLILTMIDEAAAIAAASGQLPRPGPLSFVRNLLTDPTSPMMASMLRDLEQGHQTEADHILGDLLEHGRQANVGAPMLSLARLHLNAAVRRRERAGLS